ncbi:MAG: cellulase family glycosylhydrolase [Ruminococcus sp.]|nr:cellulase family glycosylhydrolase [Ruminococcus sp.]
MKKCRFAAIPVITAMALSVIPMSTTELSTNAAFEKNAAQTVADMGFGWNLGNSLDSYSGTVVGANIGSTSSETAWGNPATTKAMIDMVKASGVETVRVPVTWYEHMDPNTYKIDEVWMNRVEEVVNYVLEDDMYCIINVHHDTGENGWLKANSTNLDTKKKMFSAIWEQVSANFADYGDKLLFEGYNEILDASANQWWNPSSEACPISNDLNQIFVDIVRKSGGNNSKRNLICNTYCAGANTEITSQFVLPKDTASNRLIVEAHVYQPFEFTYEGAPEVTTWTSAPLDMVLNNLNSTFASKGIPVIVGEFGCANKGNMDQITSWSKYLVESCTKNGMRCIWWDNGDLYKIYNRRTLKVTEPDLLGTMVAAAKGQNYVIDTTVKGDANGDGQFNVADLVILQKWVLGVPNTTVADVKAADLCKDDRLDSFDLIAMRKLLVSADNLCASEDNWSSWVDTEAGADAAMDYTANGVKMQVNAGGEYEWNAQFFYQGLTLEQGTTYKISFDYKADSKQSTSFHVMQGHDDYLPYYSGELNWTTSAQHYEDTFKYTEPTDKLCRVGFNLGGSGVKVPFTAEVANLSLVKVNGNASAETTQPAQVTSTTTTAANNNTTTTTVAAAGSNEINRNADMVADLRNGTSSYFFPSGPWTNGGVFDCGWSSDNIRFTDAMEITITSDPSGKYNYLSGEYRTKEKYGYGYYECSMMPIKADGVDTGFFMYTGPSDNDPWDEIDFEFLGYDTTKVQLNYYTDGVGGHEYMLDLGFDASQGYHTYGFDWQPDRITWYVDGVARYSATENLPSNPGRIMVNTWPGTGVDEWLKPFKGNVPLTAKYQWITWSKNK